LGNLGKGVVQCPGVPTAALRVALKELAGNLWQEANGHVALHEYVVDQRLGVVHANLPLAQKFDFTRQRLVVVGQFFHRDSQLPSERESDGVFAPQGDEVAAQGQVVADENPETGDNLNGHSAVIGMAESQSCPALLGKGGIAVLPGEIEHAEQGRVVSPQGVLLGFNLDSVVGERPAEGVHQFNVGYRAVTTGDGNGSRQGGQFLPAHDVCVDMGD